jgi:hypothetical protein
LLAVIFVLFWKCVPWYWLTNTVMCVTSTLKIAELLTRKKVQRYVCVGMSRHLCLSRFHLDVCFHKYEKGISWIVIMVVLGIHCRHVKCHYRRLIIRSKYHYHNIIISSLLLKDITFQDFQYRIFIWLAGCINVFVIWEESRILTPYYHCYIVFLGMLNQIKCCT